MIEFYKPHWLWALLLLLPLIGWYIYRLLKGEVTLQFSTLAPLKGAPRTWRYYLRHLPFVLRLVALTLIIIALARPRSSEQNSRTSTEGIDIVLALDISGSMLARDFRPNRLEAAKQMAGEFVADRAGDRIGLTVFAGEAFTQIPLTTDYATLQTLLSRLESGIVEDGTAIGNGLATAINRLRESDAKSKVIILLTDGVNNRGQIAPLTAAEIAREQGIRVYTIGVGSRGEAPYPAYDAFGKLIYVNQPVEIDEKTLEEISRLTNGAYFRATNNAALREIYKEINLLEKSKVEITEFTTYTEHFVPWILAAILVLILEFLTAQLLFKRLS
uniref:vWA domain-containing protein n=1 Tax=Alistipes sp. TaxID=1872444 RepID=UPI0040576D46